MEKPDTFQTEDRRLWPACRQIEIGWMAMPADLFSFFFFVFFDLGRYNYNSDFFPPIRHLAMPDNSAVCK